MLVKHKTRGFVFSLIFLCGFHISIIPVFAGEDQAPVKPKSPDTAALEAADIGEKHLPSIGQLNETTLYSSNVQAVYRNRQLDMKKWVVVCIGVLTPVVLGLVLHALGKNKGTPEQIIYGSGLVLVVQGVLFAAVYAPTTEQLTAPVGLLGAIAGYLFGSRDNKSPESRGDSKSPEV